MSALVTIQRLPSFVGGLLGFGTVSPIAAQAVQEEHRQLTLHRVMDSVVRLTRKYKAKYRDCSEDAHDSRHQYSIEADAYFSFSESLMDVIAGRETVVKWGKSVAYDPEWEAEELAELGTTTTRDAQESHECRIARLRGQIETLRGLGLTVETAFVAVPAN